MKPLIVLLTAFVVANFAIKLFDHIYNILLAARIGMSVMLIFTSIGHFAFTKGMSMMLPEYIPLKKELVYFTGIFEIAAAIGLLIPHFIILTGWLLIVFFILLLPANIYAAVKHLDFQKATYEGAGKNYLWFRIPLQVLFIIWVYVSTLTH